MKKLVLLPVALIAIASCNKQSSNPQSLAVNNKNTKAVEDINKVFTMSSKEDSTLLQDEGKYKRYVTLFDKSGMYSVSVSVSSDDKEVFENEIKNIQNFLRVDLLYKKVEKAADNDESQIGMPAAEQVKAAKNMTCIVTATNLPKDALGFTFSYVAPQTLSYDAPDEEGPINPGHGYNYGVYYMTLANGMVTFDLGPGNVYVLREYKNNWLSSWSSWGNTTLTPGTNDNYCIKNKNRIRVRVYFNIGTNQSCGVYGSPSC